MDTFAERDVISALNYVKQTLGIEVDHALYTRFIFGEFPNLLAHEKVSQSETDVPTLQKYLIAVNAYLSQPTQYCDFFRFCRPVILIQALASSLQLLQKAAGLERPIQRLLAAKGYDACEAALFELVVAARYVKTRPSSQINFLKESTERSPDFEVGENGHSFLVECKKVDRLSNASQEVRAEVNRKFLRTITALRSESISAVVEVTFHQSPSRVDDLDLLESVNSSLRKRVPIIRQDFTVNAWKLQPLRFDEITLLLSPGYQYERYGYRVGQEWQGLISPSVFRPIYLKDNRGGPTRGLTSWATEVRWECGIKWRVTNRGVNWRQRKFNYKLLFSGLEQLARKKGENVLHVWIERDSAVGHRQHEIAEFFRRLQPVEAEYFSWIVFNECVFDVSPKGRFDLIEHAHYVAGSQRRTERPTVGLVFVPDSHTEYGRAEFGVGEILPQIDDIFDE